MDRRTQPRPRISGVILAGGRGLRLGGRDKGLVQWRGRPLVAWLRDALAPQVDELLISANRNLDRYRRYGRVLPDAQPGYAGPLAGMLAAAEAARGDWLVCVPCDTVPLPADTVARLLQAAAAGGAAYARCGADAVYPLCAFRRERRGALRGALDAGGALRAFLLPLQAAAADFSDCALRNLNTAEALAAA